ncbi:hypothetical protein B0H10DRAFT_2096751 [Mycena sp. CBHHK59/15]|nr:hypothetical protein B0H10DRAFT_2096751 [Mycena sp. CBHHK59/15]
MLTSAPQNSRRRLPRGVSVATDGTLYLTEVFAASHSPAASAGLASASSPPVGGHSSGGHGKSTNAKPGKRWGDRPVLLLLGIRLGLDGVNPVYQETTKSVGVAGGRPSSAYCFVGVLGDGLFYLDPHHSRPAVPMHPAPFDGSPAPSPVSSRAGSMSPGFMHVNARARPMSPDANAPMAEDELTLNTSTGPDSSPGESRSEEAHYVDRGAAHVPLRARAQDAAERAGSEYADWVCVPR